MLDEGLGQELGECEWRWNKNWIDNEQYSFQTATKCKSPSEPTKNKEIARQETNKTIIAKNHWDKNLLEIRFNLLHDLQQQNLKNWLDKKSTNPRLPNPTLRTQS